MKETKNNKISINNTVCINNTGSMVHGPLSAAQTSAEHQQAAEQAAKQMASSDDKLGVAFLDKVFSADGIGMGTTTTTTRASGTKINDVSWGPDQLEEIRRQVVAEHDDSGSSSEGDYTFNVHVFYEIGGVLTECGVCDLWNGSSTMFIDELNDVLGEGLGRYANNDGCGWKFTITQSFMEKLTMGYWRINEEIEDLEHLEKEVCHTDRIELIMVIDDKPSAATTIQKAWRRSKGMKCENECSDKSNCKGIKAYFSCGHFQCRWTTIALNRCIKCCCATPSDAVSADTKAFLKLCGIIPDI